MDQTTSYPLKDTLEKCEKIGREYHSPTEYPSYCSPKSNVAKIYSVIPAIIADIDAVKKKFSESQAQGAVKYAYRRIDDFLNALNPLLGKHKAFILPQVESNQRYEIQTSSGGRMNSVVLKMRFMIFADDGSYVEASTIGEGFDSGDKASNKAMAVALKYAVMQIFMVPTEDIADPDDTDPDELAKLQSQQQPAKGASAPKKEASAGQASKPLVNHAPGANQKSPTPMKISAAGLEKINALPDWSPEAAGNAQKPASNQSSQSLPANSKPLSEAQLKRLYAKQQAAGISMMDLANKVRKEYGHGEFDKMTRVQYDAVCKYLDDKANEPPPQISPDDEIPY